jgi:hypothetical protein
MNRAISTHGGTTLDNRLHRSTHSGRFRRETMGLRSLWQSVQDLELRIERLQQANMTSDGWRDIIDKHDKDHLCSSSVIYPQFDLAFLFDHSQGHAKKLANG